MIIEITDEYIKKNKKLITRYIYKTIGYYKMPKDTYDEAFAVSCEAILKAAKKFNPNKNTKFSTFMYDYVRAYLSKYMKRNSFSVCVPYYLLDGKESYKKLREEIETLPLDLFSETITIKDKDTISQIDQKIDKEILEHYISRTAKKLLKVQNKRTVDILNYRIDFSNLTYKHSSTDTAKRFDTTVQNVRQRVLLFMNKLEKELKNKGDIQYE